MPKHKVARYTWEDLTGLQELNGAGETVRLSIRMLKAYTGINLETVFKVALVKYFDRSNGYLPIEAGHYFYRLAQTIPHRRRSFLEVNRCSEGVVSLQDWMDEWELFYDFEKIPLVLGEPPELPLV